MNRAKKLTLSVTTAALVASALASTSYAAKGKVTVETLRVRTAPNTTSEIVSTLDENDTVDVIKQEGEWYKIDLASKGEAYVFAEYVKLEEEITANESSSNTEENTEVENTNTDESVKQEQNVSNNLREEEITKITNLMLEKNTSIHILPLLFSSEIAKVTEDSRNVRLIERINNWICVEYDGLLGWVFNDKNENNETENIENNTETEEQIETKTGYVSVTSAYVRKEASTSAEILTSFSLNDEVTILKEENNWYQIQLSDGIGYIYAPLVSDEKTVVTARSTKNRTETVQPIVQEEIELHIENDNTVEISENNENEENVNNTEVVENIENVENTEVVETQEVVEQNEITENEEVYEEEIQSYYAPSVRDEVVNFALNYKGYRYVYGGAGPYTFDCSGFTMYVFNHFGVYLPHDASVQVYYGDYVNHYDVSNLLPGDLLLFRNKANTSIGHAGIYIGDGLFIHAENSRTGVVVTSIYSNYYSIRLAGARRLVY